MFVRFTLSIWFGALALSTSVSAQPDATVTGTVTGWQYGEANVVLLAPRHVPPPFVRPGSAPTIGAVASDGAFTINLPESFPDEDFVPAAGFLDPTCSDLSVDPPDASYVPIIYAVYRDDESLLGEIFRGSPGVERGPLPGEFTTLPGYAEHSFSLNGSCPDPRRSVIEDYDFTVDAGWHELIQSFTENPERVGWRTDLWRNQAVPDEAIWILIQPPR